MDDGIKYLINYINKNQVKSVLEIGTAIGYSAIMMALSNKDLFITTIERDEKMIEMAMDGKIELKYTTLDEDEMLEIAY